MSCHPDAITRKMVYNYLYMQKVSNKMKPLIQLNVKLLLTQQGNKTAVIPGTGTVPHRGF